MTAEPLLPVFSEEAAPFFEGCHAGELRIQRCRDTGRLIFPPRAVSPWGSHAEPEWTRVSGRGTISELTRLDSTGGLQLGADSWVPTLWGPTVLRHHKRNDLSIH